MRALIQALETVPLARVGELYGALGEEQRKVWDQAEDDLQAAAGEGTVMLTLACDRYQAIMTEVVEFAERKVQHARIARDLRAECWMAREEN